MGSSSADDAFLWHYVNVFEAGTIAPRHEHRDCFSICVITPGDENCQIDVNDSVARGTRKRYVPNK